jgi:predicted nucleotidyltransferase
MESPFAILYSIARTFEELGILYVVVGSFASSTRGLYRATSDLDIVADLRPEHVQPLVAVLRDEFYLDEVAMHRAISSRGAFNAIHFDSVFKVDVFIPLPDEFSRQQLARRQPEQLAPDDEQIIYVATSEDTILAKLKWFRMGNEVAGTQWKDVLGIIGIQGKNLDLEYLRGWGHKLDVIDLLEKAITEGAR